MSSAEPSWWLVRTGAVVAVVVGLLAVGVSPALAHTRAGAASDFDSRLTGVPSLPGVEWRVYAGGDMIELTNHGPDEVLVAGYAGEPYLRVGPDGVFGNRNSPATYLNAERYGDIAVPPRADAEAAPDWVRLSDRPSTAWHDHRVHWMSPNLPPAVERNPGGEMLVATWQVPLRHAGQRHELAGELWWVAGPAAWPYLLVALVLTAPAAVGVLRSRRGDRLRRPAALVVAAVAAGNGIHFLDDLAAWPAPALDVAFGVFHTALFVGAGLVGAGVAWHGRQGPNLCLGIASGAVLFHQGLLQLGLLSSSQLPTIWPPGLLRLVVALSVAQAVWVALVLVVAARQTQDDDGARGERGVPVPAGGPVVGADKGRSTLAARRPVAHHGGPRSSQP